MKITDSERLMLLMMCDIYDRTGANGEFDTDFIRSAIFGEKNWSISWKYPGIPFESQETPELVKDVLDILDMWSFVEYSYKKLSSAQKVELEVAAAPFGKSPQFRGFDRNNETDHMSTAAFVVNQLDRFVEFKGRDFNSHFPTVAAYKRMLVPFLRLRNKLSHGPLNVDDLSSILKEQVHPDNREL